MNLQPVDRWIVCVTGFLQNEGVSTGLEILQDRIHRQCGSDNTRVLLRAWDDSPSHIANRIWNRRPPVGDPKIVLIGYSYGGYTAVKIADELRRRGMKVEQLILCDAVWRPWKRLPSIVSLLPFWTIKVPINVQELSTYRQTTSKPAGHEIVTLGLTRWLVKQLTAGRSHRFMDELPAFVDRSLAVSCPGEDSP